jgi:aldehyde dehydrogenase (NAD+)
MFEEEIKKILNSQREFFATGKTLDINFRREALIKLKTALIASEEEIINALQNDLRKPLLESYTAELGMAINEINFAMKNLKKWVKPQKTKSPWLVFPARSYIIAEPYGVSLIISPWNYPIQLTLIPLIGAIAAGNCCVVKPSEYAKASENIVKNLIGHTFDSSYIAVIEGDEETGKYLLEQNFDKIFFTGSPRVGKIVMEKAARNLSSVTLELGGKSPCIVDKDVNIDVTAKRILWGKFTNAGQTCIAPDYLIVHKEIKERLYAAFKIWLKAFFTENPQESPDLGRIINRAHFNRLIGYLNAGRTIVGGNFSENDLYIEPTIIEVSDMNMPLLQEEIFGPILPVVEYSSLEDIESIIALNPNPLAFYLFSTDRQTVRHLIRKIPFGGGCINDTLSHAVNHHLPFGGRGASGIGSYHGRHSFEAFSYQKAVLEKGFGFDMNLKYPPYKEGHKYIKKYLLK